MEAHKRVVEKLIVAIDGSEGADDAVSLACETAGRLGVPVELVFVFQTSSEALVGFPGGGVSEEERHLFVPGALEQLEKETTEAVFSRARQAIGEAGVTVEETVLYGLPGDMLVEHANNTPGAMMVMARRGRSNVTELLLGSISQRVLHRANCPVVLVP